MRRINALVALLIVMTIATPAWALKRRARAPKPVRPSSLHVVGEDFHAKVPAGWFNLERIQLEEARATDPEAKRQLNKLVASYRLSRADGSELLIANV
ncbi:MAG TPA: hypothetical protein VM432_03850, partial [Bdellovibrionales bacterium]|nr:hypothetical protein [Bdellovibrionales bacterium]